MKAQSLSTSLYDDLQPYFADLSTLPRLSAQEEKALLCRLRLAQQGCLSPEPARAAKQRLVEGCLHRVIRLAREQQPLFHRFSLADLTQEGNIGLLHAVEDFDFTDPQGNFFAYATACMRNAITRTLPRDGLLHIHRWEFWQLAEQGRLKEWDRSQPLSLDVPNKEEHGLYDVPPACSTKTSVASDAVRLHVKTLLIRLTPRERTILRLFSGLDEADGRTLSRTEIATLFGLTPEVVKGRDQARLAQAASSSQGTSPSTGSTRQGSRAAGAACCTRGQPRLGLRAPGGPGLAHHHAGVSAGGAGGHHRCQRLDRASAALALTGAFITVERLAKAARVSERAASDFMCSAVPPGRHARDTSRFDNWREQQRSAKPSRPMQ